MGVFVVQTPMRGQPLKGFTLLEVLVACGILVLALSGIAALLPASGYRLAQAAAEDRAAFLAANAMAMATNSGLARADAFPSSASVTPSIPGEVFRSVLMGCLIEDINNNQLLDSALREDTNGNGTLDPPSEDLNRNGTLDAGEDVNGNLLLDRSPRALSPALMRQVMARGRAFLLEDDLAYAESTDPAPANSFSQDGVLGVRSFKGGVCWGASLCVVDPGTAQPTAGALAVFSVAVFKKQPQSRIIPLHAPPGLSGVARAFWMFAGDVTSPPTSATPERRVADESLRRQFLQAGTSILVLPAPVPAGDPIDPPVWIRVNSSWTTAEPNVFERKSVVTLSRELPISYFSPMPPGSPLPRNAPRPANVPVCVTAICYDNLLRLEERQVVLK
jgi:type II secretory pathway pseudopilin PulG